jgi:hypothetical protein
MLSVAAAPLRWCALLSALWVALLPVPGAAQAGKVAAVLRSVTGTVFQQPSGGQVRVVPAGTELAVGDTVGTQKGAFALVVFSDGSRVALRPESAMAIRGYSFKSDDPVNDQVSMQLLKGWLRVVSGQIGKRGDQAAFQLKANDTTIGIRGTDFAVRICDAECQAADEGDVEGVLPQSGRLGRLLASAEPLRRLRDGTATLEARIDTPLFLGDVLVAGEVEAVIGLDDGTRLVLGPGARLALRAEEDDLGRRAVRLDLLEGQLRVATPPQPRARLYGLLVNAGRLVGVRHEAAVDLACEGPARAGAYACDAATVEVREGLADVLSTEGLRTLRPGERVRLVEPPARPAPRAEARSAGGTCTDALSASAMWSAEATPPDARLLASATRSAVGETVSAGVAPRVAPLQDDPMALSGGATPVLRTAQFGAAAAGVQRLFDPRDIPPEGVRPAGAAQRPEPGVYAAVFEGMIAVDNPTGRILVPAGQGAFSPPLGTLPPRLLPVAPRFMERDRELERSRLAPDECIR